eukprot:scaffold13751_cov108-Isochrysis_galbana.AAC.6
MSGAGAPGSHLPSRRARRLVQVESRDAEHLPRTFAVGAGDERRVDVHEAVRLEERVRGEGQRVADAHDGTNRVCAWPQVGERPQVLESVRFLGQGEVFIGGAHHRERADP